MKYLLFKISHMNFFHNRNILFILKERFYLNTLKFKKKYFFQKTVLKINMDINNYCSLWGNI